MNEKLRNTSVGLVALLAIVILITMILLFAGLPAWFQPGYELQLVFPATADAHVGDPVHLAGVRIGKITHIGFAGDKPSKGVVFVTLIEPHVKIPATVAPFIYTRGLAGGAYVQLEPGHQPWVNPDTGQSPEILPTDGHVTLTGELKTGMIPDDVKAGLASFSKLAQRLNALLGDDATPAEKPTGTQPTTKSAPPARGLKGTLQRVNTALDNLNRVLSDENRKNLGKTLANMAKASDRVGKTLDETGKTLTEIRTVAKKSGTHVDKLSAKLLKDTEKLSTTLDSLNRSVKKIETGQGTAGKLVNDPQLYNNLVEATDQLSKLVTELREMTAQWKKDGIRLKLK